jgi:hypothetical protein
VGRGPWCATDVMSPDIIRSIYVAYYYAHLRYGSIFWGDDTESDSIFKLQKRAIRIISNVVRHTSYVQLFKDVNILLVACMKKVKWYTT